MTEPFFFKETFQRAVYQTNPLISVTVEIRFPALLKLKNDAPSELQEVISDNYPVAQFREQTEIGINLSSDDQPQISKSEKYVFLSQDSVWKLVVSSQSLSLTTTEYESWELFQTRFLAALEAFQGCYKSLRQFSRLGLRYRNVIDKKTIGLESHKWSDLITPLAGGLLVAEGLPVANVLSLTNVSQLVFQERKITLRHELLTDAEDPANRALLLDADYFTEKSQSFNSETISSELTELHGLSGPLFRWCITDLLHQHLNPKEAE